MRLLLNSWLSDGPKREYRFLEMLNEMAKLRLMDVFEKQTKSKIKTIEKTEKPEIEIEK